MGGSNRAKAIKEPKVKAGQQIKTPESQTLQQVLIHDKQTFDNGFQCISNFIERNASMEMHKAIAIQVLSTAIVSWGSNILNLHRMLLVCLHTLSINGQQNFTHHS